MSQTAQRTISGRQPVTSRRKRGDPSLLTTTPIVIPRDGLSLLNNGLSFS